MRNRIYIPEYPQSSTGRIGVLDVLKADYKFFRSLVPALPPELPKTMCVREVRDAIKSFGYTIKLS